jgi:hypothetical protein
MLGVIAVGVLLIAYGLLSPRADAAASTWNGVPVAADSRGDAYQFARPRLRCEPGQRAIVRQMAGGAEAECVDSSYTDRYGSMRTPVAYQVSDAGTGPAYEGYPASRRSVRVERSSSRDWQKTAMVIGGTTAASAGVGAIFGGRKGALIGAAIGGGASSIYEARKR